MDAPRSRLRLRLLLALAVHLALATFLAFDGVDRLRGSDADGFDPSGYPFVLLLGSPVLLALLGTLLPGRGPRRCAIVLGVVGLVVALLLVPLYGLGLVVLPGAAAGLWAALAEG